jgi:hypothetical protein
MTKDETAKLLTVMRATYANLHFSDPELALETWWRILQPDDYTQIMDAFAVYARTDDSGFAPSPGKLHQMISTRLDPGYTSGEIKDMLTMASRNANYGFQEEFDSMPPLLQKAVGSPAVIRTWGTMEPAQLEYAFSSIVKAYERLLDNERQVTAAAGTSLDRIGTDNRMDRLTSSVLARIGGDHDD